MATVQWGGGAACALPGPVWGLPGAAQHGSLPTRLHPHHPDTNTMGLTVEMSQGGPLIGASSRGRWGKTLGPRHRAHSSEAGQAPPPRGPRQGTAFQRATKGNVLSSLGTDTSSMLQEARRLQFRPFRCSGSSGVQ